MSAEADRTLATRRRLPATREQVFRAFAEADRLVRWWGPAGFTEVEWRQMFDSGEVCRQLAAVCVPANEQNLDRLQAELARAA